MLHGLSNIKGRGGLTDVMNRQTDWIAIAVSRSAYLCYADARKKLIWALCPFVAELSDRTMLSGTLLVFYKSQLS